MSPPVADHWSREKQRSSLTKNATDQVSENLAGWKDILGTQKRSKGRIYDHPRRVFTNSKEKTSHKIETEAKGVSEVTEEEPANDHQTDALMFQVTSKRGNSN